MGASPALWHAYPDLFGINVQKIFADTAEILNPGDRALRRKFSTCGVVRSASSFMSKVPTPGLAAALDAIRAHACDGLRASDVAKTMHVSRRLAERRFKNATGKTILKAVHERRLEVARKPVCLSAPPPLDTVPVHNGSSSTSPSTIVRFAAARLPVAHLAAISATSSQDALYDRVDAINDLSAHLNFSIPASCAQPPVRRHI